MPLHAASPFYASPDLRRFAEEVLATLGRVRFACATSLVAFAAPLGIFREHVAGWVRAGLVFEGTVKLDPLGTTEATYLALTAKGARELRLAGHAVSAVSPSRLLRSSQKRAHDVAVGETALAVLCLARHDGLDLVGLQVDDPRFATSVVTEGEDKGPTRVALQADVLFAVREAGRPRAYLVEVDRGTISAERMREKYAAYLEWQRGGGPESDYSFRALRVLTVAPDARRLARLEAAALEANEGRRTGFLLFAEQKDFTPSDAGRLYQPVVRALGSPVHHGLFEKPE